MRLLRFALWPFGVAFGVAAVWIGSPELAGLDATAGFAPLCLGLVAWSRRPGYRAGPIMACGGFAWFLGTLWSPAVFLHRGPLAHLLLSYPSGKLSSRLERSAVVAAYIYAAAYPIAGNDYFTIAFALGLVALSGRRYAVAGGPEHRARLTSLIAATAFGLVLALGAADRLAGLDTGRDVLTAIHVTALPSRAVLAAYEAVVVLLAVGLFVDVLRRRWAQGVVTGLVVDLGEPAGAGMLRDRLARALGDPTLTVAYRLAEQERYVDEAGRPLELPGSGTDRAVTPIEEGGRQVAALIHDSALLDDPDLVSAVASAARLAVANARLQAEVRARVVSVEESRRRIVEAADEQRRHLGRQLRQGAQRRLERVGELVLDVDPELERQLASVRAELGEFARGVHPATLTDGGLGVAIGELVQRLSLPVELAASPERYPAPVEAAAYFVCSEALANVEKHAKASLVRVRVVPENERLTVEVTDDGIGGADLTRGSGLRGLADRVEALGGRLRLESKPECGTRLVAEIPLGRSSDRADGSGLSPVRPRDVEGMP
jgi:signal transduction histidine kinase